MRFTKFHTQKTPGTVFDAMSMKNGLDLYSLSRLMGHESIAITQRYLDSIQDFHVLTAAHKTGVLANLRR